jgi:hypothetical protein
MILKATSLLEGYKRNMDMTSKIILLSTVDRSCSNGDSMKSNSHKSKKWRDSKSELSTTLSQIQSLVWTKEWVCLVNDCVVKFLFE